MNPSKRCIVRLGSENHLAPGKPQVEWTVLECGHHSCFNYKFSERKY